MAWLEKRDDGAGFWVRDVRDGRQVFIPAGSTRSEAQLYLEQYEIRRDLEKEGYFDSMQALLDDLWGPKVKSKKERNT